jgi:t-SNARE complex subunit (syntaxin)
MSFNDVGRGQGQAKPARISTGNQPRMTSPAGMSTAAQQQQPLLYSSGPAAPPTLSAGNWKESIGRDIATINTNVVALTKLTNQLGTDKDTHDMRERLQSLSRDTKQIVENVGKDISSLPPDLKREKAKFSRDFETAHHTFTTTLSNASSKMKQYVAKSRAVDLEERRQSHDDVGEHTSLLDHHRQQQFLQVQQELKLNEETIREREAQIREFESTIIEINDLVRDLGSIVADQEVLVDNIAANIDTTETRVTQGVQELSQANKYQKSSRNKMCWLLLCLLIICGIVVIMVVMTNKTK